MLNGEQLHTGWLSSLIKGSKDAAIKQSKMVKVNKISGNYKRKNRRDQGRKRFNGLNKIERKMFLVLYQMCPILWLPW